MFKVNHLFGNNGSLPSLGGTSLAAALAGVERAETALAAARALARVRNEALDCLCYCFSARAAMPHFNFVARAERLAGVRPVDMETKIQRLVDMIPH